MSGWGIRLICGSVITIASAVTGFAAEYHVATNGSDAASGSVNEPFRTIQRAAEAVQAGDIITVHGGVYRERVNPLRGGDSDERRIVYQAAPGEKVEIKGTEVVTGWTHVEGQLWCVTLPDSFFGDFNPFRTLLQGDWFWDKNRTHHRGSVYVDGEWLAEAATREDVFKKPGRIPMWFVEHGADSVKLYAQFPGGDAGERLVEVSARETVFYPDTPGRNFITVRGFTMSQAATPWAPPTSEQVGLIGTHWSRGWIIESNTVSFSMCAGISLGKYGDEFDNKSASPEGYVRTIERALTNGWIRGSVGHHVVRGNHISHCEQAGIVGSLGCSFSTITGNIIHDIHVRGAFGGLEQAGIKLHGAVDTLIANNRIYRCVRGIWLDWMAQGARVSGNLLYENSNQDVFLEMNHGPHLLDNNIMLSKQSLNDWSEEGAYIHNWFGGNVKFTVGRGRKVPYLEPHSTPMIDLAVIAGGGNRFFNNVFTVNGLSVYDRTEFPLSCGGNVYAEGAIPYTNETDAIIVDPESLKLEMNGSSLQVTLGEEVRPANAVLINTEQLGHARLSGMSFENPDGVHFALDRDFSGNPRNQGRPVPGPFEFTGNSTKIDLIMPRE